MRKNAVLLLMVFLSACAEQVKKPVVLVPVEERNTPLENNNKATSERVLSSQTASDKEPGQTASVIIALIDEADGLARSGNADKAAATIERALRIEPRNALLWHQLASVKLQQQQWQQAIAFARKSNALAADNRQLKSNNWGLIAQAYEKLGDKQKASDARKKQTEQS